MLWLEKLLVIQNFKIEIIFKSIGVVMVVVYDQMIQSKLMCFYDYPYIWIILVTQR